MATLVFYTATSLSIKFRLRHRWIIDGHPSFLTPAFYHHWPVDCWVNKIYILRRQLAIIKCIKDGIKKTLLVLPYIWMKNLSKKSVGSQSNEAQIIDRLVAKFNVPKSFIEFGFSGWEFNCCNLARDSKWEGLLIDGGAYNITIAKQIFHKRIMAKQLWLTLDSLDFIASYAKSRQVGVLSVDVDGNDYWFLEKLISINPALIITEFNVSFRLRPISVPYDPSFDRTKKHESWEYYGASLFAFNHLCSKNGYSLVDISQNGVNAFFVRNDLLTHDTQPLTLSEKLLVKTYPDGSIAPIYEFWEKIKGLSYIDITNMTSFMDTANK